jgi:23S rRNA (adenine2030-N6)-methyltransferase
MNYRHAYHAGNFADVVKHAILARILAYLNQKEAAWRVIDTHAGIGVYDLAADEALKTGEWQGGVGRVRTARLSSALRDFLQPWTDAIDLVNGGSDWLVYPGSPMLATSLGRRQDRFVFNELHPVDADQLAALYRADKRVRVTSKDGYITAKAECPPQERRGVVVIDPPFEADDEFDRMTQAMSDIQRRFAAGIQLLWYPLKDIAAVDAFHHKLRNGSLPKLLCVEQWLKAPGGEGPLTGAGLIVANPPWTLATDLRAILPELCKLLATGDGFGGRVDWLTGGDG